MAIRFFLLFVFAFPGEFLTQYPVRPCVAVGNGTR